jgi:hypothetical protein
MLNAHKDIAFPPETHFFRNYLGNIHIRNKIINNEINYINNKILNDKYLKRLGLDLHQMIGLSYKNSRFDLKLFYINLLAKYASKQGKIMIGDKDPKNIEYLNIIKKIFPESYIIHIIRDPRDVVVSRMKAAWSKNRPFIMQLIAYREQLQKGIKDGEALFDNHYYHFLYEKLIDNPEEILKKICKLLKIDYDPEMINSYKKAKDIIKGEEKKWKENCFRPIISNNYNKWQNILNKRQVLLIEHICSYPFNKFGYELSLNNMEVNILDRIYFKFINLLFLFMDCIYIFYHRIKWIRIKNVTQKYKPKKET